ncbi:Hypothetical predicted protein [Pelobates cultripes]|uniref:Uncharacterized protein n=1 Tax=Pelobates cultripes TaxID=61616 RepID=A0AAD1RMU6_PELCU|nr:Hypothetical predicted protein [Pelobates cultripes]
MAECDIPPNCAMGERAIPSNTVPWESVIIQTARNTASYPTSRLYDHLKHLSRQFNVDFEGY